MTYDQLITLESALEASLLSASAGVAAVKRNGRETTYHPVKDVEIQLVKVKRDIKRYNQRAGGQNPGISTASFRNG